MKPENKLVALTIIAFVAMVIAFSILGKAKAVTRDQCMQVSPDALVWTGHGFSITLGQGNLWVHRDDVHYDAVEAPFICMPAKGMMELLLPHAWPSYAVVLPFGESRITPVHQKLISDGWVDRSSNKKGERCCDAGKDCHSLPPERVVSAPGGVTVTLDDGQRLFIPGSEIMPSEDGKYWVCYWGGQIKCFFAPYSGS